MQTLPQGIRPSALEKHLVDTFTDFWNAVVVALGRRGTGEVQYILKDCVKKGGWNVPDTRKHIDEAIADSRKRGVPRTSIYQYPDQVSAH